MSFSAKDLLDLGRVQALAVAPDGKRVVIEVARVDPARAAFVPHLFEVSLQDGSVAQLTRGPSGCRAPSFRQDGALAFLSSRPRGIRITEGGPLPGADGEHAQVWVLPPRGEAVPVTDEPLGVLSYRFSQVPSVDPSLADDILVVKAPLLPDVAFSDQRAAAQDLREKGPSILRYSEMPVRQWDHWVGRAAPHLVAIDPKTGARRDLAPEVDRELREVMLPYAHLWALSPDGRTVITEWRTLGKDRIPDVRLVAIDVATGVRRDLLVREPGFVMHPVFSPDGRTVACTVQDRARDRHGKVELWIASAVDSPGEKGARALANDWDRWPTPHTFTPDGARIVCTADDDGTVPVFTVDVATGAHAQITSASARGSHDALVVHPDGRSILGLRHTFHHPPEPFQVALPLLGVSHDTLVGSSASVGDPKRVVGDAKNRDPKEGDPFIIARVSGAAPLEHFETSSFETKTEDGALVQWWLVRPKGVPRPPVLFWIHGGPIGQFSDGWHWRWNPAVLASAGYAVILPNPRGSTGRGQAFVEGIWGNVWGGACYRDLMRVADDVEKRADLDGTRVGAMGGSFGGYMANWVGGQTDRFRAIVTHASLYHLEAFGQTTDVPAWFFLELGAELPEGRDALDKYSPHRAVRAWKTPTLVIHGEKDYRVPIGEALSLFESLQRHGVESELCVFPDEGHWILKPRNALAWYECVLGFVDRHLKE
jgi:dipeptidyl aminopeptidase/acylaminoacyl peptidase